MNRWTSDELNKIGNAEELQIASLRSDGTLRKPLPIWVVRVGDDLYVRSMNGPTAGWFRGVDTCPGGRCQGERHEGHIRAGGVEKDVTFVEESNPEVNDQIDQAYGAKYGRHAASIISHMTSPGPRSATIKLVPR
ncbi:MAG TPA: DUF2255 family protein [Anaerolineales bacterium]